MHRYQVLFKDTKDVSDFVKHRHGIPYGSSISFCSARSWTESPFLGIASLLSQYHSEPLCLTCTEQNPEFDAGSPGSWRRNFILPDS